MTEPQDRRHLVGGWYRVDRFPPQPWDVVEIKDAEGRSLFGWLDVARSRWLVSIPKAYMSLNEFPFWRPIGGKFR